MPARDFRPAAPSAVRIEVAVPEELAGGGDQAALRAFRDALTRLLVARADKGAFSRSWHAFCDDGLPSRSCCPGDGASLCRLRKINVKPGPDGFVVVALTADRFLRGMARRAVALAVAVHRGWVPSVAAADEAAFVRPWASDDIEALGPAPDARTEFLACARYARVEKRADAVDAVRAGDGTAALAWRDACLRNAVACRGDVDASWAAVEAYWAARAAAPAPCALGAPSGAPPPLVYAEALAALRRRAAEGWPESSAARARLLVDVGGGGARSI